MKYPSFGSIEKAIKTLIKATELDEDKVSCIALGNDWDNSEGTVFIVTDSEVARDLFKFLRNQNLATDGNALKPLPQEALAVQSAVDANLRSLRVQSQR